MIYDKIEKLQEYLEEDVYQQIENFIKQIGEGLPEGTYPIMGDRVFASVMSYPTNLPEECKIEAHNKYIDIQVTLVGAEGISVYGRDSLKEKVSYDAEKDVAFYETEGALANAHTENIPGYFTMLYPEDAHRPQERIRNVDRVKKYVIKVAV